MPVKRPRVPPRNEIQKSQVTKQRSQCQLSSDIPSHRNKGKMKPGKYEKIMYHALGLYLCSTYDKHLPMVANSCAKLVFLLSLMCCT